MLGVGDKGDAGGGGAGWEAEDARGLSNDCVRSVVYALRDSITEKNNSKRSALAARVAPAPPVGGLLLLITSPCGVGVVGDVSVSLRFIGLLLARAVQHTVLPGRWHG